MDTSIANIRERRKCRRYRGCEDKAAFVAIRPDFRKLGRLEDVSLSGLRFKYTIMDEQNPLEGNGTHLSIDLFVSKHDFYLRNLKCRLAYDKFVMHQSPFTSDLQFRYCGLKFDFDELTEDQKDQIDLFLKNFTAGYA